MYLLSHNFGHQIAITAGLQYARETKGVMIMDGDLQDPPQLIHEFLEYHEKGQKRKESFAKRLMYKLYYRIFRSIASIQIPLDSGDFSFLSRRVVDCAQ